MFMFIRKAAEQSGNEKTTSKTKILRNKPNNPDNLGTLEKIELFITVVGSAIVMMGSGCITAYHKNLANEYGENAGVCLQNCSYIYKQTQQAELEAYQAISTGKTEITAADFELHIMTDERLSLRESFLACLQEYFDLLVALFNNSKREQILTNTDGLNSNLVALAANHPDLLDKENIDAATRFGAFLPALADQPLRKKVLLQIMKLAQPWLENSVAWLQKDVSLVGTVLDSFYGDFFLYGVYKPWQEYPGRRTELAALASQSVRKRAQDRIIAGDLTQALDYIPRTHRELRTALQKNKKTVLPGLLEFIEFCAAIKSIINTVNITETKAARQN